jgi:hypothetical protein
VSDHVPPDRALAELHRLVRHLGDELASYRRRALTAEARLKSIDEQSARLGTSPERSFELEKENAELMARLEGARARTKALLKRVRFLQQQHDGAA